MDNAENRRIDIPMPSTYEELQQYIAKSFQNLGAVTIERDDGSTLVPVDISFFDGEEIFLTAIAYNSSRFSHRPLHYLWEQQVHRLLCEKGR